MFVDDNILDEIRLFYLSKITVDDIAIYYDYDTTKDFVDDIQSNMQKEFKDFLIQFPPNLKPLAGKELTKIRTKIEKNKTNPERVSRLLKKKIIGYALSLSTFDEICRSVGKTKDELEHIITQKEIIRLNEEALAIIRQKQFEKAVAEGDVKMLTHLGQSYIDKQKKEASDINVQLNSDNRKVVILPPAKTLDQILKEQAEKRALNGSTT